MDTEPISDNFRALYHETHVNPRNLRKVAAAGTIGKVKTPF